MQNLSWNDVSLTYATFIITGAYIKGLFQNENCSNFIHNVASHKTRAPIRFELELNKYFQWCTFSYTICSCVLLAIAVFEGSSGMLTDGDRDMNNNTNSDKTYMRFCFLPFEKRTIFTTFNLCRKTANDLIFPHTNGNNLDSVRFENNGCGSSVTIVYKEPKNKAHRNFPSRLRWNFSGCVTHMHIVIMKHEFCIRPRKKSDHAKKSSYQRELSRDFEPALLLLIFLLLAQCTCACIQHT